MQSEEDFLRSRGWNPLWHPDNWVHESAENPDWAGVSKEKALLYEKNKDAERELIAYNWKLQDGKWFGTKTND